MDEPSTLQRHRRLPSGEQLLLHHGDHAAVVVAVGGGLRQYAVGERQLLDGYDATAMADGARGQLLAPWPNRIRDGRYTWEGTEQQLALTEPDKHHAIHGLARWSAWQTRADAENRATLSLQLPAQTGYPFEVDLSAAYELDDTGLTVRQSAFNTGDPCPYASGAHPYVTAGTPSIDECMLHVPAATHLVLDERQIPIGRAPVAGTGLDFRTPRRIGSTVLDTAYTDLERDADGIARVTLRGPAYGVELWVDEQHPYLMVFSGDTLAPQRRRQGLGVEPMTAAPNAFQSGDGLRTLGVNERFEASWGIRLLDAG